MIFFPNKTLERYTYTSEEKGLYDEDIIEYEYADTVLVDFQNENNQETAQAYGIELHNLYVIYFDNSTIINDTDILKDQNRTYKIIGNIREYNHFLGYKKANLVLEVNKL